MQTTVRNVALGIAILAILIAIALFIAWIKLSLKLPTLTPVSQSSTTPTQDMPSIAVSSDPAIETPSLPNRNLGELLFQEDFNGNINQWPTGTDNGDTYYIENGEYHVIAPENNESGIRWLAQFKQPKQIFDDFYLETKVRFVEGSQQNDSYGVLFRYSNDSPYIFVIGNAQQVYSLHTDKTLIWWTYSPKIVKDGTNIIGILCKGKTIVLYINGTQVDSIESDHSSSGYIGLDYAGDEHIAFDYIYVWALVP